MFFHQKRQLKSYINFNCDYILIGGPDGYQLLYKHYLTSFDCHKQHCPPLVAYPLKIPVGVQVLKSQASKESL